MNTYLKIMKYQEANMYKPLLKEEPNQKLRYISDLPDLMVKGHQLYITMIIIRITSDDSFL